MSDIVMKRIAIIFSVLLIIVAIAYLGVTTVGRSGKTPIHVTVFPADTTVTINGNSLRSGTTYLEPATYTIRAEKEGYDAYKKVLVLDKSEQTIAIIMVPNTEETMQLSKKDEAEYRKAQKAGEVAAYEIGKTFNELNPIAKHLPYKTFQYSIGYRMDQSDPSGNAIIIEIDAIDGYRQAALYRIRQLGYDPTDFTINFRDYKNPFPL